MDPVGGVDVGGIGALASLAGGVVAHPEGLSPAVVGFEQAQRGARVGALAAGEDAHAGWPAGQLVPARAFAQQPGQLVDVRLVLSAPLLPAPGVRAGVLGAAFPQRPVVIDRVLPGALGHPGDRLALTSPQIPTHRVGQLMPGPPAEVSQAGDQPVAGTATLTAHHQLVPGGGRQRGDGGFQHREVIGHRVRARTAAAHHPGQRLTSVVAIGQQRGNGRTL